MTFINIVNFRSPYSCCCEQERNSTKTEPESHPALFYLDIVCIAFFIVELSLRFAVCPWKKKFWKDALNVIDLVCIVPYMISIVLRGIKLDSEDNLSSALKIIIMLRIVRILRIFKLMKHYSAFKILVYTLKVSTKELFLMVVFLMSGVLVFGSLIHYIEPHNFPNIPIGIWWALVTMTTVGYGDKYTVTPGGYAIGSVCVICGVLVIAFTVPIVVNNFSLYYSHAQTRIKAPNKKKRKDKVSKSLKDIIKAKQQQMFSNDTDAPKSRDNNVSFNSVRAQSLTSRETSALTTTDDERQLVTSRQPPTKEGGGVKSQKYKRMIKRARDTGFALPVESVAPSIVDTPATSRQVQLTDLETLESDVSESDNETSLPRTGEKTKSEVRLLNTNLYACFTTQ